MITNQDRLSGALNEDQYLLAISSLFQEEFSIDWLEEISGQKASWVLNVMEGLTGRRVLEKRIPGVYSFKNPEIRGSFQGYLTPAEITGFHRTIASLLMLDLPDDDRKISVISYHLLHIPNDLTECRWLFKAGNMYINLFRMDEAEKCFIKIIKELTDRGGEESDILFIKAVIEYSNISTARDDITKMLSLLQNAMERAGKYNAKAYQALLQMHIAKNKWLLSRFDEALELFENGVELAETLGDPELTGPMTSFKTYFLFWQGKFRAVIDEYEKIRPDVDNYPMGQFHTVAAITVARAYTMVGQFTHGLGMLHNIREYCLEKGNLYMASRAGLTIASSLVSIGRIKEAINQLKTSLQAAQRSQNYYVMLIVKFLLGYAYYLIGNKGRSIAYLREFLKHTDISNVSLWIYSQLVEICWSMEEGSLPRIKRLSLKEQLERQLKVKSVFIKGIAWRYKAFLARKNGASFDEIESSLFQSINLLQESGNPIELAKSQIELGRLYLSQSEEEKGKKLTHMAAEALEKLNPALIPDELKSLVSRRNLREPILKEILELGLNDLGQNDDNKIILEIITRANRIIGAERGAIFQVDNRTNPATLRLRTSKNLTLEQVNHPDFGFSMKMMLETALSNKGRIIGMNPDESYDGSGTDIISSRIIIPITIKEKVIGLLYHDNRLLASAFKESDIEVLSLFAALIAYIVDNRRAYQIIERLTCKLKDRGHPGEKCTVGGEAKFEEIIGKSPAIEMVLDQIPKVATSDSAVLILGETGVGKELVARAIHENSLRKDGPFIRVQCSAFPESLITTELFGHEKGAFTGATNRRIGRFELANGGSFFLDEIGDLSPDVQIRLLRVFQTKEFERIGGAGKILSSDFRLIAATNRDLEDLVSKELFRADLYYRVSVFPIHVPPLRERKEDIPLLAEHFLSLYSARVGKMLMDIPEEEMEKLMRYDWPGNIRELENVIERGAILSPGPELILPEPFSRTYQNGGPGIFPSLKDNERRHIIAALHRTDWKIRGHNGAAELLKIPPSTLASKMKKLDIRRPVNIPWKRNNS